MWLILAFASAIFAGLGAVLSKVDEDGINTDVATAIRFTVIFGLSWIVPIVTGSVSTITQIDGASFFYLIISGISMGISWICYFKALSLGDVNRVVPVDKSSIVMSVLFAFLFIPGERVTLLKIVCMIVIAFGTYLMFPKKGEKSKHGNRWVIFALLSALGAALTSTFSKMGAHGVDADLGTAIRATVMLAMAWIIPMLSRKMGEFKNIRPKALTFTILSGVATCLSWIVYYRAMVDGPASVVTPIEKLNLVVCIVLSYFLFKERLNKRYASGVSMIALGTLALLLVTEFNL